MLTRYEFRMIPDRPCRTRPEWGYHLYAAMLERLPREFGQRAHEDGPSPVSQFVCLRDGALYWSVTLLGEEAEALAGPVLEASGPFFLQKDRVALTPSLEVRESIADADELFRRGGLGGRIHRLDVCTAAAFKSRGQYLSLPTPRLILQSLMKKWNGCFPDCPIVDEDGQGMEAMAEGLTLREFCLRDAAYSLKGRPIPGFRGTLTLENRLSGFHRELADALLVFSGFSGVGIKTTLGMGGVRHISL
ncbi:MAG: CRISPR system precrRNA processing endoribonuclease RAMP protein Cas6 [Clostridiales bacterium]|nr:CRISPR system precrRNA processing endoribonuclease RAMP protein Cas6 [Clostridiales bacterium]